MIGIVLITAPAPPLSTSKGHSSGWKEHVHFRASVSSYDHMTGARRSPQIAPQFGNQFIVPLTGSWLAGVLTMNQARFHHDDALQRCAVWYAMFVIGQSLVALLHPWAFSICPPHMHIVHQMLFTCVIACHAFAQLALLRMSVLRLQFVAAQHAAERGRTLLWALGLLAACAVATFLLMRFGVSTRRLSPEVLPQWTFWPAWRPIAADAAIGLSPSLEACRSTRRDRPLSHSGGLSLHMLRWAFRPVWKPLQHVLRLATWSPCTCCDWPLGQPGGCRRICCDDPLAYIASSHAMLRKDGLDKEGLTGSRRLPHATTGALASLEAHRSKCRDRLLGQPKGLTQHMLRRASRSAWRLIAASIC